MKVVLHPKLQYSEGLISSKSTTLEGCIFHPKYRTQAMSLPADGLACTLLHIPVATGDEEDVSNCNCNERGNETNRKEKRERERERECVSVFVYFFVGKRKERICSN